MGRRGDTAKMIFQHLRVSASPCLRILHWCPRKELNLQPLVCRTSAPSVELLGPIRDTETRRNGDTAICFSLSPRLPCLRLFWRSELESNQPFGFFRPALIRLSYPTHDIANCRFSIADWMRYNGQDFNRQLAFGNRQSS